MGSTRNIADGAAPAFEDAAVAEVFAAFPEPERAGLLALRGMIFETAAATAGVGPLRETLKWGQPAYLTPRTKAGSTIRLGLPRSGGFALYVHCRTTIIPEMRDRFPNDLRYEGTRAVHFEPGEPLPADRLRAVIRRALTYRLR